MLSNIILGLWRIRKKRTPKRVGESWEYRRLQVNHQKAIGTQNRNGVVVDLATNLVVEALLVVAIVTLMKNGVIQAPVGITSVLVVE